MLTLLRIKYNFLILKYVTNSGRFGSYFKSFSIKKQFIKILIMWIHTIFYVEDSGPHHWNPHL